MNEFKLPLKPFEKITTMEMWTDPYISKQMLNFHIDSSNNIASRKGETIQKTVDFITSHLKKGDIIVDYGCGPGLYTNLLQQKGLQVIGCDISETSLNYARKQNNEVDYRQFNYIQDQLNLQCDAAMMIYVDFGAMPIDSQCKFLHLCHQNLKDNGLFFFDVCAINQYQSISETKTIQHEKDGFYMTGPVEITTIIKKYDEENIVLKYNHAIGYKTIDLYNWDKYYEIKEIEKLLDQNGFKLIDVYSNTMGEKDFTNPEIYFIKAQKLSKSNI